jgi:23S rRNA pseudouridine2605 synthase
MAGERLQKIIAQAGLASRRKAEELIRQGKVRVNGAVVTELGTRVDPGADRIEVDGRRIARERPVYILLNKPPRTVTTAEDPEGRRTVMDLVKGVPERLFPVGRLDYGTAGALLLTNDGELAQALAHPSSRAPRSYRVKLEGEVTEAELERLRKGVRLEDGLAKASEVHVLARAEKSTTISMTLFEGRNHQIHRMIEALGRQVQRLTRLSFAGLTIDGLEQGEHRPLKPREVARLRRDFRGQHRARQRAARRRLSREDEG